MRQFKFLFIAIILLIVSCKKDTETLPSSPTPTLSDEPKDFIVPTIVPTGDEAYLNGNSDYIFDQEKLPTFELWLPNAALAALDADPTAEQYEEGTIIFESDTISPVGIRYKGSIGAWVNCLSGSNVFEPSGSKTCTKLSMKIKINWNGSDALFYDMKKLQFHSMNNDPTQMRERLGYYLFRSMGVPGPRCVHARLMINGTYSGLYALTEQIDGRFTRYNFQDGKGNLYKEIWPLKSNGQAQSEQEFLAALETNRDENPTAAIIRCFAEDIVKASPDEVVAVVKSRMDMDEIISYAVVDRMIRNDDGAFHWYCDGNVCEPHNFFWFEEQKNNKVHLIPWDLDHAFDNINSNANPVTPIKDDWGEITNNCQPFSHGWFFLRQKSAACDKLTGAWASDLNRYEQLRTEFKAGPFSEASTNQLLDTWTMQVRAATLEAAQAHGDAISESGWNSAVSSLRNKLDFARNQ